MRELTFKGYLLFQLKELSGCNTTSLYIFSNLASSNARLQDALTMYLVLYTKEDLKNRLIKIWKLCVSYTHLTLPTKLEV